MASIVLSFVGNQDPYSDKTKQLGSIVSLVNHLYDQGCDIKRVMLLYTEETVQNAIDTQQWLVSEVKALTIDVIELIPVSAAFSDDPVNPLLATQEARQVVERAKLYQTSEDVLEFNASSGTPAMKTAWSVLQALGYASIHSHVWQVRNPKEMRPGQERVFYSDVNLLRDELDLKVIKQQVQDYNYSGALVTIQASNLCSPLLQSLLNYGYYRLVMDFDAAFSCLGAVTQDADPQWVQGISPLRQKETRALLQEAYFNILIRLKNRKYADFLVGLFNLQEQLLYFLVRERIGLNISGKPSHRNQTWQVIQQAEQGKLYQFLQNYRLPRGDSLDLNRFGRYVLQAIVEYYPQFRAIMPLIQDLNQYCELRNDSVHGFVGVSAVDDEPKLLSTLRRLMKQVTGLPDSHPFDRLNQQIGDLLDRTLQ